jgi:outer membrane protein OmpA-like peptidoglycan-associated protein
MEVSGGYNLSLSDKLDGIPRTNANLNPLTNAKNDGFFGFSLGLAFTIFGGYDEAAEARAKALAESAEKARIEKQLADAEAARVKAVNDAEALRVKELSEAEARRLKDLSDAEARRLAELKAREKDTVIVLAKGNTISLPGIHFASGKAILSMDSEPILDKAYNALVANPNVKIVITSHTDNVGSEKANIAISLKRAQAVRNWLVKKGIASDRMRTVGRGPAEPVASNETADGRAQNRRIEFYVEN